jgi:ABC-2 type transport system permease protein
MLFRRDVAVRYAWLTWSLPFDALNLLAGLAVWLFYARAFGNQAPFLKAYGGDVAAYLILGVAVTPLLQQTMRQFYHQTKSLYAGSWSSGGVRLSMAEYLAMAKIPLGTYIAAQMFWGYVTQFIHFGLYLAAAWAWFGFQPHPGARYDLAALALLLGLAATAGIGLISASMVWLIDAWHDTEPVHWLIGVLVPLVCGSYFPPSVLPGWLQVVSAWLPHTYALDAMRRSVLGTAGASEDAGPMAAVASDLATLAVFAFVLLTAGALLFRWSLQVGRRRAVLS